MAKKPKRVVSKATRAKLSKAATGRKATAATRKRESLAQKGKKRTALQRRAQSIRQTGKHHKISAAERAKLVARLRAMNHKGRKLSASQKAALAKSRKTHKITPAERAAMSAARKGKHLTAATKAKLSAADKGRKHPRKALRHKSAPGLSMHPPRAHKHAVKARRIPRGLHRMVAAKSERIHPGHFKHGRRTLRAHFKHGVAHRRQTFRTGRRHLRRWK